MTGVQTCALPILLKARNIFLDTCAYEHQRFRFDHAALKKLRELGRVGFLKILMTETVDGEVRSHIGDNLDHGAKAFDRFQTHAGILQGAKSEDVRALFRPLDSSVLRGAAVGVWEAFLEDAKVIRVGAETVNAPELLALYFSQKPPFSEKKKSEFPDAISLLSLAHWCQTNAAQLYIVGDDPDLRAWCAAHPDMHHLKSLGEFLDLYNRAGEKLSELAVAIFEREEEWILSVVQDSFLECTFTYAGNWEADVENVEVTSTCVDNADVIEVDEQRFVLALDVEIHFRADVSGPDYDRGWWDSEEKLYMHLPDFHLKVSLTERFDVSFQVTYDLAREEATEIQDVLFNDGKEIKIRHEDGWPYK